ncbi:MAG: hypothetical protein WA484_13385 [Solirubrobacteraceae bacterium]
MLSWIARRFTYTNVAMTLALVFAMTGGAFAANKYLITSTKQIKPSVLKQLQGKSGKAGPEGKAGAAGLPGKDGTNGINGQGGTPGVNGESVTNTPVAAGASSCAKLGGAEFKVGGGVATFACDGKAGANGVPGESVVMKAEPKGANCKEGGANFVVAGKTEYACNGSEGSPWTAGGTLPKGKTLTGQWAAGGLAECAYPSCASFGYIQTGVSLALPLAFAPTSIIIGKEEGKGEPKEATAIANGECTGTSSEPGAAEGKLCVFISEEVNLIARPEMGVLTGPESHHTYGFKVFAFSKEKGAMAMTGSWAATAT